MSKCQRILPSNVPEARYKLLESRCRFRLNTAKLFGYPEEHNIFFCSTEQLRTFSGGESTLMSQVILCVYVRGCLANKIKKK